MTLLTGAPSVGSPANAADHPRGVRRDGEAHGDRPAMLRKRGSSWEPISWSGYQDAVARAARALVAHGVPLRGRDRGARPQPARVVRHEPGRHDGRRARRRHLHQQHSRAVPLHRRARGGGGGGGRQPAGARASVLQGSRPASLRTIVLLEGKAEGPGVVSWEEFLAAGESSHEAEVARRRAALTGDSPTTLIYTSGTDRHAQGGDAHAAQPGLHRRDDPGAGADRHRGLADQLPPAVAHRRAGRLAHCARSRRAPRSTSPRASTSCPRTSSRCGRTSSSACRACGRRCRRRSRRRGPRRARCAEGSSPGRAGRACAAGDADQARPDPSAGATALADAARLLEGARAARARPRAALAVSAAPIAKETLEFFQSLGPARSWRSTG